MSEEAGTPIKNLKSDDKGLWAIISLAIISFILKVGIIIQTILTIIWKNKVISALTMLLSASTTTNIYLGIENESLQKELTECAANISEIASALTTIWEPTECSNETEPTPQIANTTTEPPDNGNDENTTRPTLPRPTDSLPYRFV
ncbi:uncharacterized protein LOC134834678 [Culicoides brevitarsis]|uniref:uncharacterized protein LOC134834678 n=1 Tax=Culicoides brevitarsis TaxID=469753 RepID=UPI00307C5080